GDGVPVAGLAGTRRDSVWRDAHLQSGREIDRPAACGARRGARVRDESGRAGHTVSSCCWLGRPHPWLPVGDPGEGGASAGGTTVTATTLATNRHHGGHGGHGEKTTKLSSAVSPVSSVVESLGRCDWPSIETSLDDHGFAKLPPILTAAECEAIAVLYTDEAL